MDNEPSKEALDKIQETLNPKNAKERKILIERTERTRKLLNFWLSIRRKKK